MKPIVFLKKEQEACFSTKSFADTLCLSRSSEALSKAAVAAGAEGQVFLKCWHLFHHRLLWEAHFMGPAASPLLAAHQDSRSRAVAGAPFFSQSPSTPGSEPCHCQKGKGLQCLKGREKEKRRCKCARVCVCALGGDGDIG